MIKEFKFQKAIEHIIDDINAAKNKANSIYGGGNIKSSGDEVEDLIREKISLFLPDRYIVKQGHIINSEGLVSNQLDIIIFDRLNTPKFFEANNSTVFYPIESVLAIGEIKKTLRKNDAVEFGKKIKYLKVDMKRTLIENTVFGGLTKKSIFSDMINMKTSRRYKNPLFSFIFAIDSDEISDLLYDDENEFMPNDIYILNYGFYLQGDVVDNKLIPKIEDESKSSRLCEIKKPGVLCMAMMLKQLIDHLNDCSVEPFGISHYMADPEIFGIRGSDAKIYDLTKLDPINKSDH